MLSFLIRCLSCCKAQRAVLQADRVEAFAPVLLTSAHLHRGHAVSRHRMCAVRQRGDRAQLGISCGEGTEAIMDL